MFKNNFSYSRVIKNIRVEFVFKKNFSYYRVIKNIRVIRVIRVQKKIVSFVFKYFIRVQKQSFLSCSNDVVMMFIA